MEALLDTEVIAGIILGLYFIIKGAASVKRGSKSPDPAVVVIDPAQQEHQQILTGLKELRDMLEEWDDMIKQGDFTSPWTEREVQSVLDKLEQLVNALHK